MTSESAMRFMASGGAQPFTGPAAGTRDGKVAAKELAGVFYSMIISEMQKSVPDDPYMGGGRGEETFRSLWTSELGRSMAWRRDDALSAAILESIDRTAAAKAVTAPAAACGGRNA